jgi:energy-coupling factor transport system substrate-specific component
MKARLLPLILSYAIYALTTGIGILMFLAPFILPTLRQGPAPNQAHAQDSPLVLTFLVGVSLLVLLLEVQGQAMGARFVALLGVLVSINAVLRFAELIIPMPGGFSPIFFLIVLTGYVFGGRFGFLMGVLSLLVSAIVTGGVGPWLPSQMFAAGWVGLSAPLCRLLARLVADENKKIEVVILALFAGLWGFLFGAIMNLWSWPYFSGPADQYWQPGIALGEILQRYGVFYLATSFVWDTARAVGNFLLVLAFGLPALQALRRFERRFQFVVK